MIDLQLLAKALEKVGDAPIVIVPKALLEDALAEIALCRAGGPLGAVPIPQAAA